MSKTTRTFDEWSKQDISPGEFLDWLAFMKSRSATDLCSAMREAFEAGRAAAVQDAGVPVGTLSKGDVFRKVGGTQVYLKMTKQHLNIIDPAGRCIAVNAKGNPIKMHPHKRVTICDESEFFPAKGL
jgi:hypothetical protein